MVFVLFSYILAAASQTSEPDHFFREYVGLKDDQIARIQHGKAFAKVLDSGFKGGIVRKVAVDKTRSSLEKALQAIKGKLESQTRIPSSLP